MKRSFHPAVLVFVCAAGAAAQVTMNSTETFDKTDPGASWNVGGDSPLAGWHVAYINHDATAVQPDRFWFGNTVERHYGTAVDQPYPRTHSGDVEGTLLVQHDCCWGNGTDPATGQPYFPSSDMIAYISFAAVPGHIYEVSAWFNTIENQVDPADPATRDGVHPRVVNSAYAGFPVVRIGLKDGLFNPATDFAAPWAAATGMSDMVWLPTPVVQATASGSVMTIILQVKNPDTKCGAGIITDTWWDDVHIADKGMSCPGRWADTDGDLDVDLTDFAALQRCVSVGNAAPLEGACRCFDRNEDGRVDKQDVDKFVLCASGPGIPAGETCP